jgi:hypothetical protein
LRELYPDIRAKLFYGKDFKALMLKYGRFDVAASLSGLEGQNQAADLMLPPPASRRPRPAGREWVTIDGREAQRQAEPIPCRRPADAARPSRGSRRRRGRRNYINSTAQPDRRSWPTRATDTAHARS